MGAGSNAAVPAQSSTSVSAAGENASSGVEAASDQMEVDQQAPALESASAEATAAATEDGRKKSDAGPSGREPVPLVDYISNMVSRTCNHRL